MARSYPECTSVLLGSSECRNLLFTPLSDAVHATHLAIRFASRKLVFMMERSYEENKGNLWKNLETFNVNRKMKIANNIVLCQKKYEKNKSYLRTKYSYLEC
jgi:hypothetical protein